jgi:putative aminopeptidase FrvX
MISMYYENYLKTLLSTCGVSGYSWKIGDLFLKEALKLGITQIGMDSIGSASVRIPYNPLSNNKRPKNIMICAHIDTPGFMVSSIEKDNTAHALPIGGFNDFKNTDGLLMTREEEYIPITIIEYKEEDDYLSLIFNPEHKNKICVGDPIFFYSPAKISRGRYLSPGLDNKVGILILTLLIKELLNIPELYHNIFCVLPALEEVGSSHGAFTATTKIKPLFAINIDVIDVKEKNKVGKGAYICVGPLINKVLSDLAIDTAKKLKIPFIIKAEPGLLSSDTEEIIKANGGTPTLEINIPCYDIHSSMEIVSKKDIENIVLLLKEMCKRFKEIYTLVPGGLSWDVEGAQTNLI